MAQLSVYNGKDPPPKGGQRSVFPSKILLQSNWRITFMPNYFRYDCASPWHLAISGSEVVDQPDYTMYPSKYVVPILEVER